MSMKDHILAALREQLEEWEALLDGLSEEQIGSWPEPSWTVRDMVAHLWGWQQVTVARVAAAREGGIPRFPAWTEALGDEWEADSDRVNAWFHATYGAWPWSELREGWRGTYRHLLELAEGLSEPALLDSDRYPWLGGYSPAFVLLATYEHHQEHLDSLRAALP